MCKGPPQTGKQQGAGYACLSPSLIGNSLLAGASTVHNGSKSHQLFFVDKYCPNQTIAHCGPVLRLIFLIHEAHSLQKVQACCLRCIGRVPAATISGPQGLLQYYDACHTRPRSKAGVHLESTANDADLSNPLGICSEHCSTSCSSWEPRNITWLGRHAAHQALLTCARPLQRGGYHSCLAEQSGIGCSIANAFNVGHMQPTNV